MLPHGLLRSPGIALRDRRNGNDAVSCARRSPRAIREHIFQSGILPVLHAAAAREGRRRALRADDSCRATEDDSEADWRFHCLFPFVGIIPNRDFRRTGKKPQPVRYSDLILAADTQNGGNIRKLKGFPKSFPDSQLSKEEEAKTKSSRFFLFRFTSPLQ